VSRIEAVSRLFGIDGGLVNQHHWNVVLDGIDSAALVTLEALTVVDQADGGLAIGAGKDFEQFPVDRHTPPFELRNYNILG
jgi:hypothetical protein